jgi:predicted nucleic acid-binding Zn ribbon protein
MRKRSLLTTLDSVLKDVAHDLKIEDKMEQVMLYRLWNEAVGEQIARNASPVLVRGDVLHVNVSSSVWVQQLQFLRDTMLEKINANLSGRKIKDIRFKIGPLPAAPPQHDAAAPLPELDDNEKLATQAESARISDPELREAFQDFMAAYLKSHKPVE